MTEPAREGYGCWKYPQGKHLKTTSEWPQSGPVIPLSSNEVVPAQAGAIRVEPRIESSLSARADGTAFFLPEQESVKK